MPPVLSRLDRLGAAIVPALALLGAAARPAAAQQREAARSAVAFLPASQAAHRAQADTCAMSRMVSVPMGAAAGAGLGWLVFTVGIGALASDHGEEYKKLRRRFIVGGAMVGAVIGAVRPSRDVRKCPLPRWRLGGEP